jgi:hypothetical protein
MTLNISGGLETVDVQTLDDEVAIYGEEAALALDRRSLATAVGFLELARRRVVFERIKTRQDVLMFSRAMGFSIFQGQFPRRGESNHWMVDPEGNYGNSRNELPLRMSAKRKTLRGWISPFQIKGAKGKWFLDTEFDRASYSPELLIATATVLELYGQGRLDQLDKVSSIFVCGLNRIKPECSEFKKFPKALLAVALSSLMARGPAQVGKRTKSPLSLNKDSIEANIASLRAYPVIDELLSGKDFVEPEHPAYQSQFVLANLFKGNWGSYDADVLICDKTTGLHRSLSKGEVEDRALEKRKAIRLEQKKAQARIEAKKKKREERERARKELEAKRLEEIERKERDRKERELQERKDFYGEEENASTLFSDDRYYRMLDPNDPLSQYHLYIPTLSDLAYEPNAKTDRRRKLNWGCVYAVYLDEEGRMIQTKIEDAAERLTFDNREQLSPKQSNVFNEFLQDLKIPIAE